MRTCVSTKPNPTLIPHEKLHAAQKPKSRLKFVTLDKESNMSMLWRREEFPRICSKEDLVEKAQEIRWNCVSDGSRKQVQQVT